MVIWKQQWPVLVFLTFFYGSWTFSKSYSYNNVTSQYTVQSFRAFFRDNWLSDQDMRDWLINDKQAVWCTIGKKMKKKNNQKQNRKMPDAYDQLKKELLHSGSNNTIELMYWTYSICWDSALNTYIMSLCQEHKSHMCFKNKQSCFSKIVNMFPK